MHHILLNWAARISPSFLSLILSFPQLKPEQQQSPSLDSDRHITQIWGPHVLTQTSICCVRAADEQRALLNVPLRLTRLSMRMIPGLISPTDWIWSLGEKCPKSPCSLCLSLSLTQGSIYSNMIRWCQPQYEALKRGADQNGEYERRGFNAASVQKACRAFMSRSTVWTCCQWQQTQINCRPFRP